MIIPKSTIISSMTLKGKKFPNKFQIECDDISHITFKDIIELFIRFKNSKNVKWIDKFNNSTEFTTVFNNLFNLIKDIIYYPFLYFSVKIKAKKFNNVKVNFSETTDVLFIRSDHWFNISSGGSVGHLKGVIDGLRELNYKTNVVSSDFLTGINKEQDFFVCSPNYKVGKNIPDIPELIYNIQLLKFIESKWKQLNPTLIYQRYSKGNFVGVALKNKYKIPYICEYNGSLTWISKKWYGHKVFHEKLIDKIEILNLACADLIIVVSEEMQEELIQRGIDTSKILINPNGVDTSVYSPDVDGVKVRERYSFNENIVLGFIGTFGKWHGAEVLTQAFGMLLNENSHLRNKVKLLLIGDGVTMPEVKKNIEMYNMDKEVILTGQIPQTEGPFYLAACNILISPHIPTPDGTKFFGSPTKLFEYMAMGKPIIASDLNQIGRILENNKTAILCEPGNPVALKDAIAKLIGDKELCLMLGKNAREKVVNEFTWLKNVERVIEKYNEIKN